MKYLNSVKDFFKRDKNKLKITSAESKRVYPPSEEIIEVIKDLIIDIIDNYDVDINNSFKNRYEIKIRGYQEFEVSEISDRILFMFDLLQKYSNLAEIEYQYTISFDDSVIIERMLDSKVEDIYKIKGYIESLTIIFYL